MDESYQFQLFSNSFHGYGWSRQLGNFLKERGLGRIAMLVDEGCARHSSYFAEVTDGVKQTAEALHTILLRGSEEPDYDYLDSIAEQVKALMPLDVVIGVGGGSAIDVAKAVAVLLTNPGNGVDYRGFDKVQHPGIPTVAVPTTAGTGSEVTINAVFTDKKEMRKLGINGRFMNATWAILDAEWTVSCPTSVAISSGMDALTHTLESFSCRQHNTHTRMYSRMAFRLLHENLPKIVKGGIDPQSRQSLLLGSHLAAIALFNSGSGIAGALSYPIGVHYKAPHGIAGGIFLHSVVSYNIENGYRDYAELYDESEPATTLSVEEKCLRFSENLSDIANTLQVPKTLDHWGINKGNVEDVGRLMLPLQAAFDQNPVPFSAETDALRMLERHVAR